MKNWTRNANFKRKSGRFYNQLVEEAAWQHALAKFWWNSDHHHATLIWFPTSWKNGKVHGQMMFKTFIFLKVHLHSTAYFIIEKDYREPPFRAKSPFFAWNWELLEYVIFWKFTKLLPVLSTHFHSEFSVNLQIGGLWIRHLKKISRFSVSHFLSDPGWFALHEIEPLYIVDNFENVQGCFWCWCWCCYTWSRSFANISILKFDANFETEVKTFWTSRIGWRVSQIFQVTWVHERLPRTSLAWWDGVGSRCLMKLVHNSNILIYHEYPLGINQDALLWIWG